MSIETIALIVTAVLAVAFGFIARYIKALKESVDVISAALSALADGQVTAAEIEDLKVQIAEAKDAWKKK